MQFAIGAMVQGHMFGKGVNLYCVANNDTIKVANGHRPRYHMIYMNRKLLTIGYYPDRPIYLRNDLNLQCEPRNMFNRVQRMSKRKLSTFSCPVPALGGTLVRRYWYGAIEVPWVPPTPTPSADFWHGSFSLIWRLPPTEEVD